MRVCFVDSLFLLGVACKLQFALFRRSNASAVLATCVCAIATLFVLIILSRLLIHTIPLHILFYYTFSVFLTLLYHLCLCGVSVCL